MSVVAMIRPAPPIHDAAAAARLADLTDVWVVVARQPLCLGPLVWAWALPETDLSAFRQGRFLGAISTVQGRDASGTLCLYARRGDNRKWWREKYGG